jgi:transcriptional regulator with PAS, ATPase and Fis domain
VIAATNQNLEESIQKNAFREDLFYRLNVIYIKMPPLREVKEDIPILINHFLKKFSCQIGGKELQVSTEVLNLLSDYSWPGNVRQLENVIERAYALGSDNVIAPSDLPPEIRNFNENQYNDETNFNLRDNEIKLIKKALKITKGNKGKAAQLLGINLSTVYRKLDKYGIAI